MIECKDISVAYDKTTILNNISLKAETGKITVVLGKNGCGKSTLLHAVSGHLDYEGSIKIDGAEVNKTSVNERAKLIALMPQILRNPDITVRDLVSFGRQPYTGIMGILSANDRKIVEDVILKTGLISLADKRLGCISGGERQKAYFALLLSQNTANLLLDEPGSHLDAAYTNNLMEFLINERDNGKTILAVFHDINRAVEIADKIIVIQNSGIMYEGNSTDFCKSNVAESVFGLKKYMCTSADSDNKKIFFLQ